MTSERYFYGEGILVDCMSWNNQRGHLLAQNGGIGAFKVLFTLSILVFVRDNLESHNTHNIYPKLLQSIYCC